MTNHLCAVVDRTCVVSRNAPGPAEIAKVVRCTVFDPEHRMIFAHIEQRVEVEGCASARRARNLTLIVDIGSNSV